jgi:hypothetical protein
MLALIDGDIVAYRSAAIAERMLYTVWDPAIVGEPEGIWFEANTQDEVKAWAAQRNLAMDDFFMERVKLDAGAHVARQAAKSLMESILEDLQVNHYKLYLSGDDNFRHEVATIQGYKAHRPPKPKYLPEVQEYLTLYWDAEIVHGMEADDALGIEQAKHERVYHTMALEGQEKGCRRTIICSNDKDLRMISGWHYDFVKKERAYVNEIEAQRNFYRQCVKGDSTDNIPGLYKLTGKKVTAKVLKPLEEASTVAEMSTYVASLYEGLEKELEEIAELLWILREPRVE